MHRPRSHARWLACPVRHTLCPSLALLNGLHQSLILLLTHYSFLQQIYKLHSPRSCGHTTRCRCRRADLPHPPRRRWHNVHATSSSASASSPTSPSSTSAVATSSAPPALLLRRLHSSLQRSGVCRSTPTCSTCTYRCSYASCSASWSTCSA